MTDAPTARENEGPWAALRRRKVVQWGVAYSAAAWTLLQVIEYLGETYGWPPAIRQIATPTLALGLLVVLVLAWYHGDKDAQKVSRLEFAILAALIACVVGTLWWYASRLDESAWLADTGIPNIRRVVPADAASVAVLPFENRSDQEKDAYFVDGIHDDILTQLSKVSALKVISRTSVGRFRDTKLPLKEIAQQLGVSKILEGGVQRAGDRVRINVQLIDAGTDAHLWAETYDRELTAANIFAIQSEVAAAVAGALKTTLTPGEKARADAIPTRNLGAWEAYQLGKQRMAKRTSESLAEAATFFQKAIDQDPQFALAYASLADTLVLQVDYAVAPRAATLERASQCAVRALELDPGLAEAWTSSAMIARLRGQPDRADPMFRRAIGLDPNYATAHHWYSRMLEDLGRRDEAVAQAQRALELDPLSAIVNKNLGDSLQYRGDFEAALARYRKAIEIDPSMPGPYINIGALNAYALGRISDGVPYVEKAIALDPGSPDYAFGLALQLLDLGADVQAIPLIDAAQKRWPADAGVNMLSAAVHLYRGDQGAAVRFARQALETAPGSGEALAVLRNADLDRGEYVAALARYAKEYPKLVGPEELAIDGSNYAIAIEVVPVLQSMGDTNRAGMLLDRSEQVLRTSPRLGPSGYGIADVRVLALRGETKAALLALREAAQAGWRGPWLRYARDFDPSLAAIRTEPEFKAVFADIGRDMARQRAELAKRPRDAPLDLAAVQ